MSGWMKPALRARRLVYSRLMATEIEEARPEC
jgi:hypothetical protein